MNILGKRYFFFAFSLIIILPGLILLAVNGLPLSIDFVGGTMLEIKFENSTLPSAEAIKSIYDSNEITDVQIQTTNEGTLLLRSSELSESARLNILDELEQEVGSQVIILKSDTVGPSIGQGVTRRAIQAVALSALAVVIYITLPSAESRTPSAMGFAQLSR